MPAILLFGFSNLMPDYNKSYRNKDNAKIKGKSNARKQHPGGSLPGNYSRN